MKYILKNLFRSTLFERNILQIYFTAEKSYDVISYLNLGMISFQTMKPFILTWDSKTTFHKKCYIFHKLKRIFYLNLMFFHVAFYQKNLNV